MKPGLLQDCSATWSLIAAGRIPAQFNGCVGIKPTVGMVTTQGVVPACQSLDCISCFARSVDDAATVIQLMQVRALVPLPASAIKLWVISCVHAPQLNSGIQNTSN